MIDFFDNKNIRLSLRSKQNLPSNLDQVDPELWETNTWTNIKSKMNRQQLTSGSKMQSTIYIAPMYPLDGHKNTTPQVLNPTHTIGGPDTYIQALENHSVRYWFP